MNRLPQEIFDQIGTLLQGPDFERPALATISRQWQVAIERQTFNCISVRSDELPRFDEVVRNDRRRYVDEIKYLIVLPKYSDEDRRRFELEEDRRVNDEAFTVAIHSLFVLLQSWDLIKDGSLSLSIDDVFSPSDHQFLRRSSPVFDPAFARCLRTREENASPVADLWGWRYRYSFIRLLRPSMLPEVLIVRELWTKCMTRNLCDRVPVEIAARLPNLLSGRWVMNDWGIRYLGLRQTHRRELAQAVAEFLPQSSSLRDLSFQMPVSHLYSDYQNFSFGTLHPENLTLDTLSNAIRAATAHMSTLRRLQITGVIDKSLLWPGPTRALSEPYWQNLEYLHVTFSSRRPSGGHYFVDAHNPPQELVPRSHLDVPPGYKQSEEEEVAAVASFSIGAELCPSVDLDGQTWQPVDEVVPDASLKPLIRAFGQACLQMPMLKSADVVTIIPVPRESNGNGGSSRWGVWYFSPGTMHPRLEWLDSAFSEDTHDRRLIWDVKDWRPDADLRRLLGKIGDDKYGGRLVEKFVKSGF